VVLISIDGLRPDAIFHAPAPTLQALACKGAYSWRARTIPFSITLPSHASMVSGFLPEAHMLFHNDFRPGYIAVPTVMTAARAAGKRVVLVVGKEKMIQLVPPGDYDVFVWSPDRDAPVLAKAVEEVRDGFDLLFIHLPEVDLVGHEVGWMSNAYLAQVARTDAALAPLLQALPADATVIVSADHGGAGYIHWTGVPEDMHIPWIVAGPGVRAARPLEAGINTLDTAATAAHVLGLALPAEAPGHPIEEPWTP
jgi:predicted AlkP superfamily pyrophosphatase or phosphodiesterase